MTKELTEKEWELIDTIRNYRKIYPPSKHIEIHIQILVDELMEEEN